MDMKAQNSIVLQKRITIVCALIFRTVLAVGSLLITMFSVVVMIPFKNISFEISAPYVVEVHHFIPAVFFSLVAIIIPIAINSIFYSLWFGKKSISKLWVRVPDVIFTLVILIIMCLNLFVFNNNWSEAEWVW
jgi:hypothetical protein